MFRLNTYEFLILLFPLGYEFDNREIAVRSPDGTGYFSLIQKRLGRMRPTRSAVHWVPGHFPRKSSGRGRRQNIHIHPDSRLRMSGSIAPVSHTSFIGTILPFFFFTARQPVVGQRLPTVEASQSHLYTLHPVGLLWTSDQSVAETSA